MDNLFKSDSIEVGYYEGEVYISDPKAPELSDSCFQA